MRPRCCAAVLGQGWGPQAPCIHPAPYLARQARHPSLPASLPAARQHCLAPCKPQHGHCWAPSPSCSGDSLAHPQAVGEDVGCVGARTRDVSGRG